MKNNRVVLPLIIFLLVIFLPFGIIGVSYKIYHAIIGENPKHLHKVDNRLYFYDEEDSLIGYYDCQNPECDDAKSVIDDKNFYYYQNATDEGPGVFDGEYVFIQDGDDVLLYNLRMQKSLNAYKSIKTYGKLIADTFIILKDKDGLYRLFDVNSKMTLPYSYDYIGVSDSMIDMTPDGLLLAVKSGGSWQLITKDGTNLNFVLTTSLIYNYDEKYIYTSDENLSGITILDYNMNRMLMDVSISKIDWKSPYIIITNTNGDILIYESLDRAPYKTYSNKGELTYELTSDSIKVINGTNIDVIEIETPLEEEPQPQEEDEEIE